MLGEIERTNRGFEIIKFLDRNGQYCSLQQSSLAKFEPPGTSAVWLGIGGCETRMHLSLPRVKALVLHLQRWLEDGSFRYTEEDEEIYQDFLNCCSDRKGENRGD